MPESPTRRSRGSRRRTTTSGSRPFASGCWSTTRRIPEFIQPESRRNEIVNLVETGLKDVAITRKGFTWGIPVPFDPEQTIYVWFDALLNYITAIGYGTDEERFRQLWPADVHVIGKDITRFHCALWPAMLMSAGVEPPRKVFGHGFVYRKNEETGEIQKISKSLGNVVEPMDIISKFSAEAFRYYFMSQCPFGGDGEFSFERFADVYNSDLANNLGNLYSRILTMCVKYFEGNLGSAEGIDPTAWRPGSTCRAGGRAARAHDRLRLQHGPAADLARGRRSRQSLHPGDRAFKLAKTDLEACRVVLVNLAEWLRVAAILIKPFLPRTAETSTSAFNFEASTAWDHVCYSDAAPPPRPLALQVTAPLRRQARAALSQDREQEGPRAVIRSACQPGSVPPNRGNRRWRRRSAGRPAVAVGTCHRPLEL